MINIGQKIPNIEIEAFHNNEIKKINLRDFSHQWLIMLFYPADFTFICPTELKEAADSYEEFNKLGAEILSISKDTVFVHKAWYDNSPVIRKIKFPMLADPTGNLCRLFGTYIEEEGVSLRATFIINPEGIVKSLEMHDNSIGRNIKEILRKFQAAKFVSENNGLVCPASWQPGQETIKPGLELVGKI